MDTIALPAGSGPRKIAITPDGTRAYVANTNGDTVTIIDTLSNTIIGTLSPGNNPEDIAITPILLF